MHMEQHIRDACEKRGAREAETKWVEKGFGIISRQEAGDKTPVIP